MLYRELTPNSFVPWEPGSEFLDGSRCAANIEALWSDAELAAVNLYRPADAEPEPAGRRTVSIRVERVAGVVRFVRELEDTPLEELCAAKIGAINTHASMLQAIGAPVISGGDMLHIALDDGSRADMTAMGATAGLAMAGLVPWPDDYARGWISLENLRIPLPSASDGYALAQAVGAYYAALRQHCRDLKDAALAAADAAGLDAIDIEAGWPG